MARIPMGPTGSVLVLQCDSPEAGLVEPLVYLDLVSAASRGGAMTREDGLRVIAALERATRMLDEEAGSRAVLPAN